MKKGFSVGKRFPVKDDQFVTSSYTHQGGIITRCVKVAITTRGVAVRHSKDPTKATMFFNRGEWDAFLKGAKDGEFDLKKR
ncbi:MAG: hypothetical protein RIT04_635 [Candidatus Parcubacteria bacterium]|jgi:hypothetical protein